MQNFWDGILGSVLIHLLVVAVVLKAGSLPLKKNEIVYISLNNVYLLPLTKTASAPVAKQIEPESLLPYGEALPTTTAPSDNTEERPTTEQKAIQTKQKSVPKILVRQRKTMSLKTPAPAKVKRESSAEQLMSKPPDTPSVSPQVEDSVGRAAESPTLISIRKEQLQAAAKEVAANSQNRYVQANFNGIRNKVYDNLHYPAMARRQGWSGRVQVSFTILLSGEIEDVQILSSSGYPLLDRQALKAVEIAAPFAVPPVMATITIPVTFELN